MGDFFLKQQRIAQGLTTAEPVKVKKPPLKKETKKRAKLNTKYRKIVKAAAEENPLCEVNSPECTGVMEGMNHKQKRSVKNLLVKHNLERSCNACNGFIERFPEWAKANGHFISKFKNLETTVLIATHDKEVDAVIIEKG